MTVLPLPAFLSAKNALPPVTPSRSSPSACTVAVPVRLALRVASYTLLAAPTPATEMLALLMSAVTLPGCTST